MRMIMLSAAMLLMVGAAAAADGTRIEMQILDRGQPVTGSQITIFLSCDKLEGTTGEDGRIVLESECNGGFYWVEIDGRRVDAFYQVERHARTIDVSDVSFMISQGGR